MAREAEVRALQIETAVMNGYASVMVKGYARQRAAEWRKRLPPGRSGRPNEAGWKQLAEKFSELGAPVQQGGERLVQ